jgi:3-hydroxyacyl-CoA dehydrogenase
MGHWSVEQAMDQETQTGFVRQERRGGVMLLKMAMRPVNALTLALRAALTQALAAALANPEVQAIVICSDIGVFSAGGDIPGGVLAKGQRLADLCLAIEASDKPVVVALNGSAVGAGLELALAAHYRVALAGTGLGLPDVRLGGVPGAGGTQRLARLVGAQAALQVLLDPATLTATQALTIGLVDQVVEQKLLEAAVEAALGLVTLAQTTGLPRAMQRRDGLRDGKAFHAAVMAARAKVAGGFLQAPQRAIDCVEAAQLLSPEQGLAFEAAAHDELVDSPEAQGLRHAFLAERRALAVPKELAALGMARLATVTIWGADGTVSDVAAQALAAGMQVCIVDPRHEALSACLKQIAVRQAEAVSAGRKTAEARDADWARLQGSQDPERLTGAGFLLASVTAGPVPVATVPPVLLGALGAQSAPLGLTPAQSGRLSELSQNGEAAPALVAQALGFGRQLGWRVMLAGVGGPIDKRLGAALSSAIAGLQHQGVAHATIIAALGSYGLGLGSAARPPEAEKIFRICLAALTNEGARLVETGVARQPSDVDAVAVMTGMFPRWLGGPMFLADRTGLLVVRAELRSYAEDQPQLFSPSPLIDKLISQGRGFAALNRLGSAA